ncbi:MAG: TorF family putative porin [Pseudomonadales bacterium]
MSRFYMSLLAALLLSAAIQAQAAEVGGNVSLVSDYVYRGVSQTNENPAIQGGFDIAGDNGLYAGVWASNISYDGNIEIDFFAGYAGSMGEQGEYDLGLVYLAYPDDNQVLDAETGARAPDSSFYGVYGSIGYAGFTLGLNYSPDFFFESGKAVYLTLGYEWSLPNDFALTFHYGRQTIDDNKVFGTPDYADYSIGLSKSFASIDAALTWHDSELSDMECFGGSDNCSSRLVFGLSKSL